MIFLSRTLLVLSLVCATLFAVAQTSLTEYNYLTKGYKIQLESGLDTKKGYTIKEEGAWGVGYDGFERKAEFKLLYKDGNSTPKGILMMLYRTDGDYTAYVCIPAFNSEQAIWEKAFEDFDLLTEDWDETSSAYFWGALRMLSYSITK